MCRLQGNRVLIESALTVPVIPAKAGIQSDSAGADVPVAKRDRFPISRELRMALFRPCMTMKMVYFHSNDELMGLKNLRRDCLGIGTTCPSISMHVSRVPESSLSPEGEGGLGEKSIL